MWYCGRWPPRWRHGGEGGVRENEALYNPGVWD